MIEFLAETGSTNSDILTRLASGEVMPEGKWIVADRQTAGRGRIGRHWEDGAGNFMGSTLVRVRIGDPPAHTLALVAGLALHGVVASLLPDPILKLKWPNDLMAEGAKLAGVLLERAADVVVVGIGVNLVAAPALADRNTVSLANLGIDVTRDRFAASLADAFSVELERWRLGGLAPILRRWQSAAHPLGTRLKVQPPGEDVIDGDFSGLDNDGNLRLTLSDGSLRTIHAGDVMLASTGN